MSVYLSLSKDVHEHHESLNYTVWVHLNNDLVSISLNSYVSLPELLIDVYHMFAVFLTILILIRHPSNTFFHEAFHLFFV